MTLRFLQARLKHDIICWDRLNSCYLNDIVHGGNMPEGETCAVLWSERGEAGEIRDNDYIQYGTSTV